MSTSLVFLLSRNRQKCKHCIAKKNRFYSQKCVLRLVLNKFIFTNLLTYSRLIKYILRNYNSISNIDRYVRCVPFLVFKMPSKLFFKRVDSLNVFIQPKYYFECTDIQGENIHLITHFPMLADRSYENTNAKINIIYLVQLSNPYLQTFFSIVRQVFGLHFCGQKLEH